MSSAQPATPFPAIPKAEDPSVVTYDQRNADSELNYVKQTLAELPKLFQFDSSFFILVAIKELNLPDRFKGLTAEMAWNFAAGELSRETASLIRSKLPSPLTVDKRVRTADSYLALMAAIEQYVAENLTPTDLCLGHMNLLAFRPSDLEPVPQLCEYVDCALDRFYTPEHRQLALTFMYLNNFGCTRLIKQQEERYPELARQLCAYALHRDSKAQLTLPTCPDSTGELHPEFRNLVKQFLKGLRCPPLSRRSDNSKKQGNRPSAHQTKSSNKDSQVRPTSSKQSDKAPSSR